MKELLLADANRLSASHSEYEATRQQIGSATYETFTLRESDFYDLVFMEANDTVWANNQKLVNLLTPEGKSRTLREVVDRILKAYPYQSPIQVFKHLSEDESWFEGCFIISARFDPRLLGELLIRPLTAYEKPAHSPKIRFYLEDGNHRALVYAIFLRLQAEKYQPVRAIFSLDWNHLYPWGQVPDYWTATRVRNLLSEEVRTYHKTYFPEKRRTLFYEGVAETQNLVEAAGWRLKPLELTKVQCSFSLSDRGVTRVRNVFGIVLGPFLPFAKPMDRNGERIQDRSLTSNPPRFFVSITEEGARQLERQYGCKFFCITERRIYYDMPDDVRDLLPVLEFAYHEHRGGGR